MTLKDFEVEHVGVEGKAPIPFYRLTHIRERMPYPTYLRFARWMEGQTILLLSDGEHGVFPVDLDAFLQGAKPLD